MMGHRHNRARFLGMVAIAAGLIGFPQLTLAQLAPDGTLAQEAAAPAPCAGPTACWAGDW